MTSPPDPQLTELLRTLGRMEGELKEVRRAVEGDPISGSPSMRKALEMYQEKTDRKIEALEDQLYTIVEERKLEKAKAEWQSNMLRWAVGTSFTGLVGTAVMLYKLLFGGGGP